MRRSPGPVHPSQARTHERARRRERRRSGGITVFVGKYFLLFCALLFAIVVVDFVLYVTIAVYGMQGGADEATGPTQLATRVCSSLEQEDEGWRLSPDMEERLDSEGVWGFLMAADGSVVWTSKSAPQDAVLPATAQDIALVAHYGSLDGHPAFVYTPADNPIIDGADADTPQSDDSAIGEANVGADTLLVLVYPEDSRVVFPTSSFSGSSFAALGAGVAIILFVDLAILFVAYVISRRSVVKGIEPLSEGIGKLAKGVPASVEARGDLADIANDVNAASDVIRAKDSARANWISGVSHDVRTPLSMVMGYADRIAEDPSVPERARTEASIIRSQSMKMRDLMEDLNLASHLEYDLQPMRPEELSPASLARTAVAEFADSVDPALYELSLDVDPRAADVRFRADRRLLGRALRNLLQNAVTHNPDGCRISVSLGIGDASAVTFPDDARPGAAWYVRVADDGAGIEAPELVELQNGPASLGDAAQRRGDGIAAHGLGLLLVRGIARAHGGTVLFASEGPGAGFAATLVFPLEERANG